MHIRDMKLRLVQVRISYLLLVKSAFEFSIFLENEYSTVKNGQEDSDANICKSYVVASFSRTILCVQLWPDKRRDKHGQGINETVGIINLVVQLSIQELVLSFCNFEVHLEPLNHFWNNGNKHENLKESKNRECRNNQPVVVGQIKETGWTHHDANSSHSENRKCKLKLPWTAFTSVRHCQTREKIHETLSSQNITDIVFSKPHGWEFVRNEAGEVRDVEGSNQAGDQGKHCMSICQDCSPPDDQLLLLRADC